LFRRQILKPLGFFGLWDIVLVALFNNSKGPEWYALLQALLPKSVAEGCEGSLVGVLGENE